MTLKEYWRLILTLPPHITAYKAYLMVRRIGRTAWRRARDRYLPTHLESPPVSGSLHRYFAPLPAEALAVTDVMTRVADDLDHRFDLLGSGPVLVETEGARARVNRPNQPGSARIERLIDSGYRPIDWHVDFKSGFRWSEASWYEDVRYGDRPGVDVKVPWELGRMQHLVRLPQAYALTGEDRYRAEFRNQILDFMAANPPRFGVNWRSTMEVAIRAANWVVAYDLFLAHGANFDPDFERLFTAALFQHGRHVVANLEWFPELRSNHYLSNVAGLLFIAAYLPRSPETDAWLAFAVQELLAEFDSQFHPDGSNFEASTSYHRLSGEMIVYAFALLLALPEEKLAALREADPRQLRLNGPKLDPAPFHNIRNAAALLPPGVAERLRALADFSRHVADDQGRAVQIGDNDNGHFLQFQIVTTESGAENHLDHRRLVGAVYGLFREDSPYPGAWLDNLLIRGLPGGALTAPAPSERSFAAYPGFGLYVYRRGELHLTVRCGAVGQNGNGGHAHNDQLALTVNVGGVPFLSDPGTGLYTPDPAMRNRFRRSTMHNVCIPDDYEQNRWNPGWEGLFSMIETSEARVLEASEARFSGELTGFGVTLRRDLEIGDGVVTGREVCSAAGARLYFHLVPGIDIVIGGTAAELSSPQGPGLTITADGGAWEVRESEFSPGYGLVQPAKALVLTGLPEAVGWRIEGRP